MEDRRLAAIMFTDIVGYTTMMAKDENQALRAVEVQRDVLVPLIEKRGGKWLKEMGDGTLSSFPSTVSAVNCAIEIQQELASVESFKIRIGIHLGDVVFTETDVFGDGVNIAARVEASAIPGGIAISGQVHDTLQSSSAIETVFIGEKTLKNVGRPVKLFAIANNGLPVAETSAEPVPDPDTGKSSAGFNWLSAAAVIAGLVVGAGMLALLFSSEDSTPAPGTAGTSESPTTNSSANRIEAETPASAEPDTANSVLAAAGVDPELESSEDQLTDPEDRTEANTEEPAPAIELAQSEANRLPESETEQDLTLADNPGNTQDDEDSIAAAAENTIPNQSETAAATATDSSENLNPDSEELELAGAERAVESTLGNILESTLDSTADSTVDSGVANTLDQSGQTQQIEQSEPTLALLPGEKSIAVLPLMNLSADPDNAYFAAGIHEEILSQLAKISDIRVISRRSVLRFEDSTESISEIAGQLGVETIMEGSVRFAGDRVRINCTLIRASDDTRLWSETYERELEDIFAIQSDVALQAASAMQAELQPLERERIESPATDNTEAYTLYLKTLYRGEQESLRVTTESGSWIDLGIRDLERAIELDPEFADAYAHLAYVQSFNGFNQLFSGRDAELEAEAMQNARRALEIDPNISKAYSVLAIDAALNRRWSEFLEYADQIEALPDIETTTYSDIAMSYALMQRYDDSRRLIENAIASDPDSATVRWLAILVNIVSRDYEAVLDLTEQYLAVGGDRSAYHLYRAVAQHFLGRDEESANELAEVSGDLTNQDFAFYAFYAYLNCSSGRELATNQFALQQTFFNLTLTNLGCRIGVNDADGMFQTLQPLMATGIAIPDIGEAFDPFRDDPRYAALEAYLNLPSQSQ